MNRIDRRTFAGLSHCWRLINLKFPQTGLRNARRYWYYRNYRYTLPFGTFLETTARLGYVALKGLPGVIYSRNSQPLYAH